MDPEHKGDWYPSSQQLKAPEDIERSMRRVLDLFYEHRNTVTAKLDAKPAEAPAAKKSVLSEIGGIPVEPFDVNTLNDGDTLQYDKAQRRFVVKT